MNRTTRAVLRYTREDLKWILPVALGLGVLGEVLGLAALSLGEPENASKIVVGVLLAITFLISTIVSIVYLANQFSLFLSFSTTRQGLVAGILLHSLRISLLQTAIAFLWGTADTLVRRALGGVFPLPWQWMPWVIWPLAGLLPVCGVPTSSFCWATPASANGCTPSSTRCGPCPGRFPPPGCCFWPQGWPP